jgi:hypothetical protein
MSSSEAPSRKAARAAAWPRAALRAASSRQATSYAVLKLRFQSSRGSSVSGLTASEGRRWLSAVARESPT